MIRWFAQNSIAANFLMLAILGTGVYMGVFRIPLEITPALSWRTVMIEMPYRGGTAKDVERAVLIPIEEAAGPTVDASRAAFEKAGRVADFLEFGELMVRDALHREESCGGHFRVEHQTEDGEALRNDDEFAYVAAWEHTGDHSQPALHKEPLEFEYAHPSQRSYK